MGCAVIDGPIPRSLDDAFNGRGVDGRGAERAGRRRRVLGGLPVRLGARRGLRRSARATPTRAARSSSRGTAARRRCRRASSSTTTSPTPQRIPRPDRDATLTRLHRVTAPRTPRAELSRVRVRPPQPVLRARAAKRAPARRGCRRSRSCASRRSRRPRRRARSPGRVGILCDDRYGQDALNAATGRGWWVGRPVELPGSESGRVRPRALDRHDARSRGRSSRSSSASCRTTPTT